MLLLKMKSGRGPTQSIETVGSKQNQEVLGFRASRELHMIMVQVGCEDITDTVMGRPP
jgi:hypothetical protein